MSDTPRHDDHEGQPYRDPTAPGDESFSASSSPVGEDRGSADGAEHTEQLPTSGDTQQVPASPAVPPPPNPYGQPYPSQSDLQQRRADDQAAESAYPPPPPPPPGYGAPAGSEQAGYGAAPADNAPYGSAPYGSAPAYGAPAYGAPAYGTPAQGSPASLSGSTIALLVVSGLLTLGACGTGIPALVFAILAVTKKDEPVEAAKWTRWGWIALGITVAVVVIAVVGLFALAIGTSSSSGY